MVMRDYSSIARKITRTLFVSQSIVTAGLIAIATVNAIAGADSGTNDLDIDGGARPHDGGIDIGADEYGSGTYEPIPDPPTPSPGAGDPVPDVTANGSDDQIIVTPGTTVSISAPSGLPEQIKLTSLKGNQVLLNLKLNLSQDDFVQLNVIDALGRLVETPLREYKHAGSHQWDVKIDRMQQGVYYLEILIGNAPVWQGKLTVLPL